MKTAFTLFLSVIALHLMAQPTITAAWAPGIGTMVQDVVGQDANNLTPGDSGANADWDYSNVMQDPNVPVVGFEYADPSVSNFANLFPDANLAVIVSGVDPNTLPTTFYKVGSDQFELLGNALPLTSFIYNDPQVLMRFPFSFGDSFEDDFEAMIDLNGIMSNQSGQVVVTADAYGTIKMPAGTYDNVIRVKTETTRTDSTSIAPGSYSLVKENIVTYTWYKNTVGNNIANLSITNGETITVTGGMTFTDVLPETRAFSWNTAGGASSLEEIKGVLPFEIISYGPNPVIDNFKIILNAEKNNTINWQLINLNGQLIKQNTIALIAGGNELIINMENVPAGQYFIKIEEGNNFGVFQVNKK